LSILSPEQAATAMRVFVHWAIAALAALSAIGLLPAQAAQPQVAPDPPAPQVGPLDDASRSFMQEFDQLVLGDNGPVPPTALRTRLDHVLAQRVAAIDRRYGLSQIQKQKLKLAGRGDIERLEDRVNRQRPKYVEARRSGSDAVVRAAFTEANVLRSAVKSGPFGAGSLFAKAQNTVLSPEQVQMYERRRQLAAQSTAQITLDNASALETAARIPRDVFRIGWTHHDNEAALLEFGKPVEICSADNLQFVRTIGANRKLVGFDFSRDGKFAALAEYSTKALLLNLSTGREMALETKNQQPSVSLSPDGKLLATGGYGTRAALWSVESGKRIRNLDTGQVEGGLTPVFSPDGTILAVGNRNSSTCLFDVATGRLLHRLRPQESHELKFDPTGKRLAVAYCDCNLAVWNVQTGDLLQRAHARGEELYSVDWSPDGKILATSGVNTSVALWKAANLTLLHEIEGPEWIICVRFNPQGTRLIFAGGSRTPRGDRYVEILGVPRE
jgi:Eukaryotic translation initiation factor eIF2A